LVPGNRQGAHMANGDGEVPDCRVNAAGGNACPRTRPDGVAAVVLLSRFPLPRSAR
jgi:hypothetical protein